MDRKNVYKIVDNVDNSENRRKYRKIAVNKNVRNYLAKRQIVWIRSKKDPVEKENSIFHREQVKRKNDFIFRKQEALTDFYNVSGTHGDQHVALGKIFVQIVFDFRKGWEIFAGSAEFYNAFLDIFGGDAERIGFSGCVNIGENHMVCQERAAAKSSSSAFVLV